MGKYMYNNNKCDPHKCQELHLLCCATDGASTHLLLIRKGDYPCFAASPACGAHVCYLTPARQQKQKPTGRLPLATH